MSKKLRFIYNGVLLSLVGFASRGAGLFVSAFIAGKIGSAGIGLYSLISVVYGFGVTLATSGVSLSVTRLVAGAIDDAGEAGRVLRGAFLYSLLFGLLSSTLLFSFAGLIGVRILSSAATVLPLRLLSLSLLPVALSSVISGYFVAVRRIALNAALSTAGQVLRILLTVVLLTRLAPLGTEYALLALAIGTLICEAAVFLLATLELLFDRRIYKDQPSSGYAVKKVAGMALPLAISAYFRSFLLSLEHAIIPKALGRAGNSKEEALSRYGLLHGMALPIILFPMTVLTSFSGLLVPEFAVGESRGDMRGMRRLADIALSRTLCYSTVVAVLIFAFSEELGYVIYSSFEAGHYIRILAPVIPIMYLDHVTDSILKGIGEQVYSMWVNIADSFLSVILVALLIPVLDIGGYAAVIIIMELFNFTLSLLRLLKRVKISPRVLFSAISPLFSSILAVLIASLLFRFNGTSATAPKLVMKLAFTLSLLAASELLSSFILKKDRARSKTDPARS